MPENVVARSLTKMPADTLKILFVYAIYPGYPSVVTLTHYSCGEITEFLGYRATAMLHIFSKQARREVVRSRMHGPRHARRDTLRLPSDDPS